MPSGNIFLNYRRDDTAGHAGRLFDRLNQRFPGRVFRDVTGIAYGVDFVEEIERKLVTCQVIIVLIGKYWLTLTDEYGRRRLDDANDFVRLEVASGLRRDTRVIPVLVNGARMPRAVELPADLRPLAKRNALEITEPDFDNDAARLIQALEGALGELPQRVGQGARTVTQRKKSRLRLFLSLGIAPLIALVIAILLLNRTSETGSSGAVDKKQPTATSPVLNPAPAPPRQGKVTPVLVDEEFFNPVGVWNVEGSSLRAQMLFDSGHGFRAAGIAEGQQFSIFGRWDYDRDERVLITRDNYNRQSYIKITGKRSDVYSAEHPYYGPIMLSRAE